MSDLDLHALAPHRPLGFGDKWYVPRPPAAQVAERIAAQVRAGTRPTVVAGPPGSGKSTELAVAAGLLQKEFVACPIPLDRLSAPQKLTADTALAQIAGHLATTALSILRIKLSPELRGDLSSAGVLTERLAEGSRAGGGSVGVDLVLRVLREVRRVGRRGRTVLLVDGLDKMPDAPARELLTTLLTLKEEAGVVAVVPPSQVTGPDSFDVVSQARVIPARAVPVRKGAGIPWQAGREFLKSVLQKRLGLETVPTGLATVLTATAERSGGVLRTYLELAQEAFGYALSGAREFPSSADLDAACKDASDALHCLLRDGDLESLAKADTTSGVEIPLDRRLRFIVQGLLLEYEIEGRVSVHPSPLLRLK